MSGWGLITLVVALGVVTALALLLFVLAAMAKRADRMMFPELDEIIPDADVEIISRALHSTRHQDVGEPCESCRATAREWVE